ncbi:unnamed protein product [Merluccius merluccius]
METMSSYSQYTLLMISGGPTLPASGDAEKEETRRSRHPEVLNRQRPAGSPQLLRCAVKKAAAAHQHHHQHHHHNRQQPPPPPPFVASVARRNERERNRVRQVNAGFQTLRQHVPSGAASGKLSKVETLRSAVEYIRALQQLLTNGGRSISATFEDNMEVVPPSSPSVSSGLSAGPESPRSTCSSSSSSSAAPSSSSSSSSCCSEEGEDGTALRPGGEPELLDFAAWLHSEKRSRIGLLSAFLIQ